MAEPARKLPEEDQGDIKPVGPQLRALEGGSETTPPKRGHLGVAKDDLKTSEEAGDSPDSPKDKDSSSQGGESTSEHENQIGEGMKHEKPGATSRFLGTISGLSTPKKLALGGAGATGIISMLIFAFLTFLPLKINHIVNNLQSKFFASSESAVEQRTQFLLAEYLKQKVLPGLGGACSNTTKTINKDCIKAIDGDTPASRMWRGWRDARLENKLADDYGIEIQKNGNGAGYKLKIPGEADSDAGVFLDKLGRNETKSQLVVALDKAMEKESRWKKLLYRFKVGRLAERKYGIRRCLFFCKTQANFDDWKEDKRSAAEKMIIRRVIEPHTDMLGLILSCVLDSDCANSATEPESKDQLEKDIRNYLEKRGFQYDADTVDKIVSEVSGLADKGLSTFLVDKFVKNEALSKLISKAGPVVGWIDTAASVFTTLANAGPKFKRYSYVVGSSAMISYYVLYRSNADELKNGKVDPELLGSITSALGDNKDLSAGGYKDDESKTYAEDRVGQTAEVSPLYTDLLGPENNQQTSLLNIFSPSASAQAASDPSLGKKPQYTCDNHKTIKAGDLICPEESLKASNFLTGISDFFNSDAFAPVRAGVDIWNTIAKPFKDIMNGIVVGILSPFQPILDKVTGIAQKALDPLIEAVTKFLIPSPIHLANSGARGFNMMVGGADALGNDFAQNGIGGQSITDQQAADIRNNQETEARQQFASNSFFSKLFDTSTPYSAVSQVAMSTPTSLTGFSQSSFADILSNPFSKLLSAFSSLFSGSRVFAQTVAKADPFGVPQFGYNKSDPALTMNPEVLTDEYCNKFNTVWATNDIYIQNYQTGAYTDANVKPLESDPDVGIDSHKTTNPCLLEAVTTGSAGGYFTDAVLTKDDLNDPTGSAAGAGSVGGATLDPSLPQGSSSELLAKILATGKVTFDPGININGLKQTTLAIILKLTDKYSFNVSSALRAGDGPGSPHANGSAIDINGINGKHYPNDYSVWDPAYQQFENDAAAILPSGSWMGFPNDTYMSQALAVGSPRGVTGGIDLGTGAHFHLNVPADAP